jgi:Rieske 2Fe-2S family protein
MTLEPTLSREYYLTPELFAREKDRIFTREWFCVGREEEVPGSGDYLVLEVAGESVLLLRGKDGALHAHYNVCRHRGSQLVPGVAPKPRAAGISTGPSGVFTGGIRCPYHAWTYNLDGRLRTAPFLEEGAGFCKADLPLFGIGVDTWGGFVFLNLSSETEPGLPTLSEQLGGGSPMRWPQTGRSFSRTTTSATTAGRCIRSSAEWYQRSSRRAAWTSTGTAGCHTARVPGPSP